MPKQIKKQLPPTQDKSKTSRRSIRRIKKLLQKNISEYQIPNPYRTHRTHPYLPLTLYKQLAKFDSLSLRSLATLRMKDIKGVGLCAEGNQMLGMMKVAVRIQEQEFGHLVKLVQQRIKSLYSQPRKQEQILPKTQANLQPEPHPTPKQDENQLNMYSRENEQQNENQDEEYAQIGLHHHQSSILSDNYEQEIAHYDYQLHKNFITRIGGTGGNGLRNQNGGQCGAGEDNQENFYF